MSSVQIPLGWQLALAGLSNCAAACVTNPIDVVKVRLQLQNELHGIQGTTAVTRSTPNATVGWIGMFGKILSNEGVLGFYKGLQASLAREATYSALRLGLYEPFKTVIDPDGVNASSYLVKVAAGGASGFVGAAIANPTDLLKIRMQANAHNPSVASHKRSVLSLGKHIYMHEGGLVGLWQGVVPNVQRAILLTAAQVGSYDQAKQFFKGEGSVLYDGFRSEGFSLHVAASLAAGLVAALTTAPVDTVKTRLMNQGAKLAVQAEGNAAVSVPLYSGTLDCVVKTVRSEGLLALYKGFWPQWVRLGPHTIITFLVYEKLRNFAGFRPV